MWFFFPSSIWLIALGLTVSLPVRLSGQSVTRFQEAKPADYVAEAAKLLTAVKDGQQVEDRVQALAQADREGLLAELEDDERKKTFWLNLYNAYVQIFLQEQPGLFEDKNTFFSKDRIVIAGQSLSLDDIEHGLLRRSQFKYALGFAQSWWVDPFERSFRVERRDPRIHFALNCGAASCPAIVVFDAEHIEAQLDTAARRYLNTTSHYDEETQTVYVSSLMSWFRGDFGNIAGIRRMLKQYGIIPSHSRPHIRFLPYDWTLSLGNFSQ